jgi:hypothetical protein
MRRSVVQVLALAFFILTTSSAWAAEPIFTPVMPIDPMLPPFNKLTVNVQGSGIVETNPGDIVCETNATSGSNTCEGFFFPGTQVALDANAVSGEGFTASFGEWSGDCNGSVGACAVNMDSSKEVTAQFVALGTPVFALPVPNATEVYNYHPPEEPVKDPALENNKPISVGSYSDGLTLTIGLPPFSGNVDIYLGLTVPGFGDLIIFDTGNNAKALSTGLVPWKTNVGFSHTEETLFANVPYSILENGQYNLHLMVTPAGDTSKYYVWNSYFNTIPADNPFMP